MGFILKSLQNKKDSGSALDGSANRAAASRLWTASDWKLVLVLAVLSVLMFLPGLGATGILNSSDGYYTEAAREMLERGDLITPYLNYEPFYEKPILAYWLIIACYKVLGVSTFAARLPSALCAIAAVPTLFALSRAFFSRRMAFSSALVLLTMPLFVAVGHVALTDMPLMFLLMVSNLVLLRVLNGAPRSSLVVAYIALGLAFLCKGPISIFVTAITIAGYLPATRRSISLALAGVKQLQPLIALVILSVVALPWFVAEHFATNGEFTRMFFVEHNLRRLSGELDSHNESVWFYFPFLLGGFFPWSILLAQLPLVTRLFKQHLLKRDHLVWASIVWLLGTLLILFSSASKLSTYLLLVAPPVALLTGSYLDTILRVGKRRLIAWTAPAMVLGGGLSFIFFPRMFNGSGAIKVLVIIFVSLLIVGIIVYGVLLFLRKLKLGVTMLLAGCYLACAILTPLGLSQVYRRSPRSLHKMLVQSRETNASVAIMAKDSPSAAFYAKKRVYQISNPDQCKAFIASTPSPHCIVAEAKHVPDVVKWLNHSVKIVSQHGDWSLLTVVE